MLHISIYSALPKGKPFPKDRGPHFFLRLRFTFCLFYPIPTDLLPFPETNFITDLIRLRYDNIIVSNEAYINTNTMTLFTDIAILILSTVLILMIGYAMVQSNKKQ